MDTIFLIGGSGFIGKNLAKHLCDFYQIYVFDKYIDNKFFAELPKVKTVKLDLVDDIISKEFCTPDFIINLASVVTAERDLSLFDELISSNLKVLLNLHQRFKGDNNLKLFIQFGSSEEYGSENSPFNEKMRESPNSPYALIKQLTTNTTLMLNRNNNFPAMIVRPGNLFGDLQPKEKFISYVIDCLSKDIVLNVSPCEQKRDFIYIEDFATCIKLILENWSKCIGEIVNVSSGMSISLKEIIEFIKTELNSNSEINYGALPYRENEAMDLKCDIDKFSKLTHTELRFDILEQIKLYLKKSI